MSYSPAALQLAKPKIVELPRLSDRISFLHLDRVRIWQDRTGVIATAQDDDPSEDAQAPAFAELRIPIASINVLTLGSGTSITASALSSLHRAGTTVVITHDAGQTAVVTARPLNSRARYAEAQARIWTNQRHRLTAARRLYQLRYPDLDFPTDAPLRTLRGIEGRQVRTLYRTLAAKHGLKSWKRETDRDRIDDEVNRLLNLGNAVLYGAAAAATTALALNPALGFIHKGSANALLFDLADMHKAAATIPLAFELHRHDSPATELRRRLRSYLVRNQVLETNLKMLAELLAPHCDNSDDDVLIDDHGTVPGRINHGER